MDREEDEAMNEGGWFAAVVVCGLVAVAWKCFPLPPVPKSSGLYTYVGEGGDVAPLTDMVTMAVPALAGRDERVRALVAASSPSCGYCESTVTGIRCQSCGAPRRG